MILVVIVPTPRDWDFEVFSPFQFVTVGLGFVDSYEGAVNFFPFAHVRLL